MALSGSGIGLLLLSIIIVFTMSLNIHQVRRLEGDEGSDTGTKIDKALSGYLLALSLSFFIVIISRVFCAKTVMPQALAYCKGLEVVYRLPGIRHVLPAWNLSDGAFV